MEMNIFMWIVDLEGEVHSIWDLWISDLQECKGNSFFKVGRASRSFQSVPKKLDFSLGGCPYPNLPPPESSRGRCLMSPICQLCNKKFCCVTLVGPGSECKHGK